MDIVVILLLRVLDLYLWAVIGAVLASWLIAFEVINPRNKAVGMICHFLEAVTEPPLAFLRRYIRPVGGIDLTPMALMFGVMLLQGLLARAVW